ncbi:DUF1492 domain-containing protein [Ruminococcaceae bacterium OttesenSCG-928-A16]|nr:DUF1492 domain-containing protein [Ruminococcaceae bacterium OttesenSCG-928-A16]
MTTKEYLRQARSLKVIIDGKTERIAQLREIAAGTTSTVSDMPKGGGEQDKLGAIVATIADFAAEIAADTIPLVTIQRDIQRTINKIPNQKYRDVLELYYLNGWRWDKVAEQMHYSPQHIYRLHGIALSAFEKMRVNESAKRDIMVVGK